MSTMRKLVGPLPLFLGLMPLFASPAFHVNPPRLPDGTMGKSYTGGPLVVEGGGQCPRNYLSVRVVGGALPPGMYLSGAGQFGGTPMEAGRYEFVVRVENGCGWSDQAMTLEVAGRPAMFATPAALEFRAALGQALAPSAVQISSNRDGVPYTVDSTAPWLRARARAGRTPGAGSALGGDTVDVEIDTGAMSPGVYRGSLEVGGWRLAQPVSVPVMVEIVGPAAPPASSWSGPVSETASDPRLPRLAFGPALVGVPMHSAGAPAVSKQQQRLPAAVPGRLSRSAQLRSKYLAAKSTAPTPAAAPAPAHAPAAEHAKPSPVGEPVKKAATAEHGKPAAEAHAKPAADAHAKPAADAHVKPAADAHAKPAADAHAKPAGEAHGKPATSQEKPKEVAKH